MANTIEMLDYFDANYELLGQVERNEAKRRGLWLHCFECMLISSNNKLLYQLRKSTKINSPNKLTVPAGGHIGSGETLEQGSRELEEELGVNIPFKQLKYLGWYRNVSDKIHKDFGKYYERMFVNVFLAKDDRPLENYRLQEEELDGIFEIDMGDLRQLFKKQVKSIEAKGLIFNEKRDDLIKNKRNVEINNFTKRPQEWLKIINCCEDYMNGREDIYI